MAKVDADTIAEIKSRLSLVDIVSRYVDLKPAGDRWSAPCPFHQETKPSFTVSPDKGFYYCFGCQACGDLIEFYKEINGLDFSEALRQLAAEAGVRLQEYRGSAPEGRAREVSRAQDINSLAGRFFHDLLQGASGQAARKYLASRKISRETCQNFQLGWSPDGWQNLTDFLRKKGFAPEEGVMAGVLSRNAQGRIYDRFRARLIFPIVSLSGKTVAFGARVLDHGEPKYLNSSESPVYKKGEHLYGLYQARKSIIQSRQVCLTEGYLDVMALHQYGFANSCAVLGTALTRSQVRRLAGLAKEIILMFDGDKAGQKAALRSAEMILASGCGCRVLIFPEGEDAHSLLVNRGVKVFNDLLARSVQGLDYCLDTMVREVSPGQVMDWVKNFFRSISEISLQSFYIPRVAQTLGLAEADLRKTLDRERKSSASRKPEPGREQNQGPASRDSEILTFAACFPELRNRLDQNNIELFFCTDWARKFWRKIRESVSDDDLKLEQAEKDFYVQARMHKRHLEKNKETIFSEFEEFVRQRSQSMAQKNLKQALIRAQQSNDPDEVRRILALMQNTF